MRVGVIGGGAAGLATSWLLQHDHAVTVLEAAPVVGGHARTVPLRVAGQTVLAETGFRFIFDSNYPTVHALFRCLDLHPRWRPVNLTLHWPHTGRVLVLPPRTARHLRHLASPRNMATALGFQAMMGGLRRMTPADWEITIRDWGGRSALTARFFEQVFLPFLAASWGASVEEMAGFPAGDVGTVLQRPAGPNGIFQFDGGISAYIQALVAAQPGVEIRPDTAARQLTRRGGAWIVTDQRGETHAFDRLVLATAPWDAARLLDTSADVGHWPARLGALRHFDTTIVLHEDPRLMPPQPEDWSTLNQCHDPERPWSSEWAGQESGAALFRTWLPAHRPPPAHEHERIVFKHLVMRLGHRRLQAELAANQGEAGLFVVGLYVDSVDNHESSVASALPVARALASDSPTLARLEEALRSGGTAAPAASTSSSPMRDWLLPSRAAPRVA